MFTGLIQFIGEVAALDLTPRGGQITIVLDPLLPDIQIGESIAVDGCCLTVTAVAGRNLIFDVSDETLRKTAFSSVQKGSKVNIERALAAGDRIGGHFVLGHVDGIGRIEQVKRNEGSLEIEIQCPKELAPLMIDKGSVAVDGISLTAALSGPDRFRVYLIPHTEKMTTLGDKKSGDPVNLEGDVLGKYVQRLILVGER